MGMYTKENILDEVRNILNEPSALFWSDDEINEWIDQAAVDISSKAMCVEASGTITLASGTLEYTEPTDCIKVYAVVYSNRGLLKIHPRQLARITATASGAPQYYYHFGGKIGIYPVPGASESGGSVTILYSQETDDITDVPDEYQPYAILFAAARAKLKDQKFDQATQLTVQYLNSLIFHRQDLYERGVESKDMVRIPDRTVIVGQQG